MSHGQSQSFNAAMPLPKAMEYETIFKWRKALKDENLCQQTSTDKNLISDVCFGIYKHVMFAPKKAEEPQSPSVSKCVGIPKLPHT
jgi:hypothetical protein